MIVKPHVVFDLDDFAQPPERNCLPALEWLKSKFPNLKVTLFAIPYYANTNQSRFFDDVLNRHRSWIQFGIHGFTHESNFECSHWDYHTAKQRILEAEQMGVFEKVFKAPGWQISRDTYGVLKELDFICADNVTSAYTDPGVPNVERRPKHMKVYEFGHPWMVHGHTWNCVGNGVNELIEVWEKDGYPWDENTEFMFVTELFND